MSRTAQPLCHSTRATRPHPYFLSDETPLHSCSVYSYATRNKGYVHLDDRLRRLGGPTETRMPYFKTVTKDYGFRLVKHLTSTHTKS